MALGEKEKKVEEKKRERPVGGKGFRKERKNWKGMKRVGSPKQHIQKLTFDSNTHEHTKGMGGALSKGQ